MRDFLANAMDALKPRYSELSIFLTAITCVLVAFTYPEFGLLYLDMLFGEEGARFAGVSLALGLIATVGFILSMVHVMTKRKKTELEKTCMGVFAMVANGFAGILSGIEILSSQSSILLFFPVWNIAVGTALLYQIGLNRFEVVDEDATPFMILGATIILLIVFVVSGLGFRLSWAMRFSICMFYSSAIVFLIARISSFFHSQSLAKK